MTERKDVINLIAKMLEEKGVELGDHYGHLILKGGLRDVPAKYCMFFKSDNCGHYSVQNVTIPKEVITETYDLKKIMELLK